jgi:hypothetical protein
MSGFSIMTRARRFRRSTFAGGQFTILTGIGGEAWEAAAEKVSADFGMPIRRPRHRAASRIVDHTGDWARAREIGDTGCILVRPDQHVCWRAEEMVDDPEAELRRVLTTILGHTKSASRRRSKNMSEALEQGYFTEANSADRCGRNENATDERLR